VKEIKNTFPSFQVSVLFCGDFNCTPPFSSYRFLTSGSINQDDFDWTSRKFSITLIKLFTMVE
jgi:endonuclease/exonuclease/phosphatase (EEP) superfamily protein YafD